MWKSARDSQQTLPHFSWSNLKCFSINESHCIERWSSEQRSFVVASFFATTSVHLLFTDLVPPFLASMDPRWFEAFPYFQNLLNYEFCFCLHNFSTKCLSKVNFRHWIYKLISFPVIQDSNKLWSFLPTRYRQFSFKIFVRNHFSTE